MLFVAIFVGSIVVCPCRGWPWLFVQNGLQLYMILSCHDVAASYPNGLSLMSNTKHSTPSQKCLNILLYYLA